MNIISTPLFALEKVSLQLQWKHQFEFAGYYMAKEKGFYKNAGLDVNISEYHNGIDVVKSVHQNRHSFAVGYSSIILNKAGKNDIVLLNAIFQSSPHVLVSLKSSGLKSIKDFKGKNIMIDKAASNSAGMLAMLKSNGVSFDDMNIQTPSFKVDDLINKKTDITTFYYSNETYLLDKKAIAYDMWSPKDYGFDFYSDILFTSKKELQENPKLVKHFLDATIKGWKYAFAHVDESVDVIRKKYNTQNKSEGALLYEARTLKKLLYIDNKKLGEIDKNKIQRFLDIYNALGLENGKVNIKELIYKPSLHQNEKNVDYTLLLQILSIFILILLIILYYFNKEIKLKKELEKQKLMFESLFNGSRDAIAVLDMQSNFINVNPEYSYLTGLSKEKLLKTSCMSLTHPDDIESSEQAILEVKRTGYIKEFEKRCITKDKIIFVSMSMSLLSNPDIILISARDISYIKRKEKELKKLASIDPLTHLYNRRYFSNTAKHILHLAKREKKNLSLLMIDIDKFKNVNDKYGHKSGDNVLVRFSKILKKYSRKSDVSCRFGGEEFILLLPQTDVGGALVIAQKLRVAIEELKIPLEDGNILNFTISIGISQVDLRNDEDIEAVIRRADEALYDAKNSGRNRVCEYNSKEQ